jgi:ribose 5-phosphate isomerase B
MAKKWLVDWGYEVRDFGAFSEESVDYPDFARQVAGAVARGECARGVLICGTGIGMSIAANKVRGVRAALCHDVFSARATRQHNDSNVLTMGSRVIGPGVAQEVLRTWLAAEYEGGRHTPRLKKISALEDDMLTTKC